MANKELANIQIQIWMDAVKILKFDGIHWDTLGSLSHDKNLEQRGIHDFLKETYKHLKKNNLLQTMNFVDLAWWYENIIKKYVTFPYVEVWSDEKEKNTMNFLKRKTM